MTTKANLLAGKYTFSYFILLDTVNPAQGLDFPVAVPYCAVPTTLVSPGRVLAPLHDVPQGSR